MLHLSALPKAWPAGSVKGLKARGNVEADMVWKNGALTELVLSSPFDQTVEVRYGNTTRTVRLEAGRKTPVEI